MNKKDRIPAHPPIPQGYANQEPRRRILMTPLMVAVGGLIAFFTVVTMVVVLPTETYNPPHSDNWLPLSDAAERGRAIYLSNGCVYCHSGFTRPQDLFVGRYYLYSRVSEPGDYVSSGDTPNILGSERTGPDLSQEGGHHPDQWHEAHYWNPRSVIPMSIMPRFDFLSDSEMQDLIAFNQSQGGKEALLRYAAVSVGDDLMRNNMGMMDPEMMFPELVDEAKQNNTYQADGSPTDKSPSGLPWKAVWHMNSFDRSYWLTSNPLPVTQQNLMRGKTIYLQRCAGCHGEKGDGKGPAAQFLMPKPFNFMSEEMNGPGASDGQMYHRILTAGPGTAMENFGTRLSVEDIWRVVLFLRTIPNGGLEEDLPTVDMWEQWTPPKPMVTYVENHPVLADTGPRNVQDPFMQAARWIAPGMAPEDEILVGGKLPMTLDHLAQAIESRYMSMLDTAYQDASARGEDLPPEDELKSMDGVQFHNP